MRGMWTMSVPMFSESGKGSGFIVLFPVQLWQLRDKNHSHVTCGSRHDIDN